MLIRCEKCQALFSLQDGVVRGKAGEIPPVFAVECGRCLSTFKAAAPAMTKAKTSPGRGRVQTPAPAVATSSKAGKTKPGASAGRSTQSAAMDRSAQSASMDRSTQSESADRSAQSASGDRSQSASTDRSAQSAPKSAALARALKPNRPEVPGSEDDAYAKELASIGKRRQVTLWLLGGLALLIVLAIAIPLIRKRLASLPEAAKAKLEQAHQKLLLDDLQSLEQAAELDAQAARLAPGDARPEGERAFALLLAAGSQKDLADRGEARAALLSDDVVKLEANKADGYQKNVEAIRTQMKQISDERDPHVRAATQLLNAGRSAAHTALEENPEEPSALRAMALLGALNNAVESGVSYADKAEAASPGDPFTIYVRAQLWLCGSPSREKQDKGLSQLALVRQSAPELLRALYDTAAVDAERQLSGPAKESLDKLLAQNPLHERAQRLRLSLDAK